MRGKVARGKVARGNVAARYCRRGSVARGNVRAVVSRNHCEYFCINYITKNFNFHNLFVLRVIILIENIGEILKN